MLVERFQLVGWVRLIHPTGREPEAVIATSEATIAVGTPIAERPPHRTVRAAFPHTAPTSDG